MIVVAIIGILAAIAIPAYQDYTIRSQVTEGLNLSSALKAGVSEYYAQYGTWPIAVVETPGTPGSLGLVAPPSGKYVSSININTAGTLVITYSSQGNFVANAKIDTQTLALQPALSGADAATGNEDVIWICGYNLGAGDNHQPTAGAQAPAAAGLTTVLAKFLPGNCRA
jgi:type IV pilus assembly protein PilA